MKRNGRLPMLDMLEMLAVKDVWGKRLLIPYTPPPRVNLGDASDFQATGNPVTALGREERGTR